MDTKMMSRFEVMDAEMLATIEGGGKGICHYVYPGSNGYACRYSNGEWGQIVTKGTFETTLNVMVNGWVSSLGGGYNYATSYGRGQ